MIRIHQRERLFILPLITVLFFSIFSVPLAAAQTNNGSFSLQISPSPIIDVIKPGVSRSTDFTIRNNSPQAETLKVELKKFNVSSVTGQINLTDEPPSDVTDWIKVSEPTVTILSGAYATEHIAINPPTSVGFSYSFAVELSRQTESTAVTGKTKLKGSVAVFVLLTVDRPGVQRKFTISEFSTSRQLYEYLPASFTIKLRNTGNTIVQPFGNIYIQRNINSSQPISVINFNNSGAYLLPDVSRNLTSDWQDGFPIYKEIKSADNTLPKKSLVWDWSNAQNFRFGHYYAKLIAVYNDGQRDVPVEAIIGFWVIPWKLIIIGLVVILILITGAVTIIRKPIKTINRKRRGKKDTSPDQE